MSSSWRCGSILRRLTIGRSLTIAAAALVLAAGYGLLGTHAGVATAQKGELQGMGTVSGTVTAGKPFKAAQVYLRSADKRRPMLYMVYTQAGAFKATAVMPGNYELIVKARGLESDPQPIVVKGGDNAGLKATMHDSAVPNAYPTIVPASEARTPNGILPAKREITFGSYDEIYPAGPGRVVLENLCMRCHGENYFAMNPRSAQGWQFGLDRMMGKALATNDRINLGEGILGGAVTNFRFGLQDRKDVLEYLQANFALDKKPRAVKTDPEMPLDEAALSKAEFIEYYVHADEHDKEAAAGKPGAASTSESAAGGVAGVRVIMQVTIDAQGNRWAVDRGVPSRLVRLDPRTGETKTWVLPDTAAGVHDMTQGRDGKIWVLEFARGSEGKIDALGEGVPGVNSRLLGFNPKTEKFENIVDLDPDSVIRSNRKGPLMGGLIDSQGKVWAHWMLSGAISSYDPATNKAATYRIPTNPSVPYGACIDPFDNIWVAEWSGGKLGRFNQKTGAWTEFVPPMYPVNMRRGPEADAEGNIWVGMWAAGNRPAMIAKLDQKTGDWTTWKLPYRGSQPYETSLDRDGNIWFPDIAEARPDRGTAMGRLNPKTGTFTFYPRPQQVADSTRVMQAEDGSVHYTPRYGAAKDMSGFGVLYPDKDQITTLAPKMLNGAPGYAFKVGAAATTHQQQ